MRNLPLIPYDTLRTLINVSLTSKHNEKGEEIISLIYSNDIDKLILDRNLYI